MKILELWTWLVSLLTILVVVPGISSGERGTNKGRINELTDIKGWKQLLKTKTNVLIYFAIDGIPNMRKETSKILLDTSQDIRGIGVIVMADCTTK